MKLVFLLEPGDTIQDKDLYFVPPTQSAEYQQSGPVFIGEPKDVPGQWKEVSVAVPKLAPTISSLNVVVAREVYTEDIFEQLKSQYDQGLSKDEIRAGIKALGMLCFEGKEDMFVYVANHYDIQNVVEFFDDDEIESFIENKSTAIDAETGSKGASFWKDECRSLLREVITKEGWDAVYNRIKDLDPMQPDSGPSLFPYTDLTDYSIKSNFIP